MWVTFFFSVFRDFRTRDIKTKERKKKAVVNQQAPQEEKISRERKNVVEWKRIGKSKRVEYALKREEHPGQCSTEI